MFTSGLKIPLAPRETGLLETGGPVFLFMAECADRDLGFPRFFVLVNEESTSNTSSITIPHGGWRCARTITAKIAPLQ